MSKVKIQGNASGTGVFTIEAPGTNDPRTLTLPDAAGTLLTSDGAGDKRNFIIDGDFTQWPEGDKTAVASQHYGPALFKHATNTGTQVLDFKKSTDVPTVAQSGHNSAYSFQVDVTTADASPATTDLSAVAYNMTGNDYASLHAQEVTLNFWVKLDAGAGSSLSFPVTGCVMMRNSASNRRFIKEYTIDADNTWEEKSITLTMDSSGTWLFTEADKGLEIAWTLIAASTYNGGTADSWGAETAAFATSNQDNFVDDADNNFYLSQVGLYLGSTAPTFSSPPIATVRDQVAYYVERFDLGATTTPIMMGQIYSTTAARCLLRFRTKRATPSVVTDGGTIGNFLMLHSATHALTNLTFVNHLLDSSLATATVASGLTSGQACQICGASDNWILVDSRH
jgi:hypothetical protein